jgi:hypothetical protein
MFKQTKTGWSLWPSGYDVELRWIGDPGSIPGAVNFFLNIFIKFFGYPWGSGVGGNCRGAIVQGGIVLIQKKSSSDNNLINTVFCTTTRTTWHVPSSSITPRQLIKMNRPTDILWIWILARTWLSHVMTFSINCACRVGVSPERMRTARCTEPQPNV